MVTTSRTAASGKKTTAKAGSATAAKKPATKKATSAVPATKSKAAAKKTATPAKTSTPKAVKNSPQKAAKKSGVTPEDRYRMIATAAYFLAERRGFAGGYEMGDWIAAEAEIDAKLRG
jgi:Protein of unknown function (DUF2934)